MLTSIASVGAAPSVGSFWMKSVIGVAFCHASSSRCPSTRIDPFGTRVALACLRLPAPLSGACASAGEASERQKRTTPTECMDCGSLSTDYTDFTAEQIAARERLWLGLLHPSAVEGER